MKTAAAAVQRSLHLLLFPFPLLLVVPLVNHSLRSIKQSDMVTFLQKTQLDLSYSCMTEYRLDRNGSKSHLTDVSEEAACLLTELSC